MTYRPTNPEALQEGADAESPGSAAKDLQTPTSYSSSSASLQSSAESSGDSRDNPELRQLKRALRELSSCNRARADAWSERQLLDEFCDLMLRMGGSTTG